jgi:hypothetical protein
MTMSGTRDSGVGKEKPEWREEPFKHMPPGNKYHVLVSGAMHLTFAVAELPRFRSCILSETTAFWDAYLKDMAPEKAKIVTTGACMVSSK